jgi:Family of unknown function (DUF5808)
MARRRWGMLIGLGLVGAAVATELRKPSEERTWQGRLAGIVPYDFRPPTFEKMQHAWWSPDEERLFSEMPFGVGWTLNFGRLAKLVSSVTSRFGQAD